MANEREGLGQRFTEAVNRVVRDNAPSWREPSLPGLAPDPVEKMTAQGYREYHAKTDRIAAERLPKETPAPVTYRESLTREGQAEARYHARDLQCDAAMHPGSDFADKLIAEARDVLKREGLDDQGKPRDQERFAEREREYRERNERKP